MRRRLWAATLCGAVATGGTLVGVFSTVAGATRQPPNGVAGDAPNVILRDALTAIDSVSTVRVSGGNVDRGAGVDLDLVMVNGKGGYGTVTTAHAGTRVSYRLLVVGSKLYLNGDHAFWELQGGNAAQANLLQGRWVRESATSPGASTLAALFNVHTFFAGELGLHGALEKLRQTTVMGEPAIAVTNAKKTATVYVASTGKPYPLELVDLSANGGTLVIDRINWAASLTVPPHAIQLPAK